LVLLTVVPSSRVRSLHGADAPPRRLQVVASGDADRAAVEDFIAAVFRERHGAELRAFAPTLVALRDRDGEIVAAAGWRSAGDGGLFLERYLDAPVQQLLAARGGTAPAREHIVEVGHLSASRAGAGRRLIVQLAPLLAAQGFQWVVSTLTEELRHLFQRLGVAPLALAAADPAPLGADAAHWGRYYERRPQVLAGHLESALHAFAGRRSS
jgi:hypothetical protein